MLPALAATLLCTLPAFAASDTLFERLGGMPGVTRIVDDLIEHAASDPATRRSFDRVNLQNLKRSVVEQFCWRTGGPCQYTGDDMRTVHQGLAISEAEFYSFVQLLRDAADRAKVGEGPKNELLHIFAPLKRDVVKSSPGAGPATQPAPAR